MVDAVLPNRTAEAVEAALDGVLARDEVLLCVDGDAAVIEGGVQPWIGLVPIATRIAIEPTTLLAVNITSQGRA